MMAAAGDLRGSLLFHADQNLCSADVLFPTEVLARIKVAVLRFLHTLTSPRPAIPNLALVSRKSSNSRLRCGLVSEVSSVSLSSAFFIRSLMNERDAKAFVRGVRNATSDLYHPSVHYYDTLFLLFVPIKMFNQQVWKVMELCSRILVQGKKVTQRELFYKLLCESPEYFGSQAQVNRTVQDVVALLRCTRYSLGIMASSKGAVVGRLLLKEPDEEIVDCSVIGPVGHPIKGDLNVLKNMILQSDARYIIVIEKDAIFQRFAEDQIFNKIPCILITAKGYPDMATRVLLHQMSTNFPDIPILALVDWNPAGLAILCTYKFGSIGMGLEAYRYACNVKWLGLRGKDLQLVQEEQFIPLKPRDHQIAKSLMSSEILQEVYRKELELMVESNRRAEIESLYYHGFDFLWKFVAKKIVQIDYI